MHPIDATLIQVPLGCGTKEEAIASLLDLLVGGGLIGDREKVLAEILEREAQSSTAIGHGAAIPHARSDHVEDTVCAFGKTPGAGIEFGSAEDPHPANLVFLMVSPRKDTTPHIKTLAKIARIVRDEARRGSLCAAATAEEALAELHELTRA